MTDFKREYPMFPWADAIPGSSLKEQEKLLRAIHAEIAERSLVGLANNTKWNELIATMRGLAGPVPWTFPFRSIATNDFISEWDTEWTYHLPFPFRMVRCLDLLTQQVTRRQAGCLLPITETITSHSDWLEALVHRIGFDYLRGQTMIRIFGYAPREMKKFDVLD